MGRVVLVGAWRVHVVRKVSDWPQQVVISGSVNLIIPGQVGLSAEVRAERCHLTIQHAYHGVWQESAFVHADPVVSRRNGRTTRIVTSKDHYWAGDASPNDLVLVLEQMTESAGFDVVGAPRGVDDSLRDLGSGGLADPRARYMAVEIANTGYKAFGYDTVLDISDVGRVALAEQGILVEGWRPATLAATGQEAFDDGVSVPPLGVGEPVTSYFPIDNSKCRPGTADIEFVLYRVGRSAGKQRRTAEGVAIGEGSPDTQGRADTQPQVPAGTSGRGTASAAELITGLQRGVTSPISLRSAQVRAVQE